MEIIFRRQSRVGKNIDIFKNIISLDIYRDIFDIYDIYDIFDIFQMNFIFETI